MKTKLIFKLPKNVKSFYERFLKLYTALKTFIKVSLKALIETLEITQPLNFFIFLPLLQLLLIRFQLTQLSAFYLSFSNQASFCLLVSWIHTRNTTKKSWHLIFSLNNNPRIACLHKSVQKFSFCQWLFNARFDL